MKTKRSAKLSPEPRPRLGRAAVVDAAMALATREGLGSVTIRRVADKLSVTPMAFYWHFADKDALMAAISERLWDEVRSELEGAPEPRVGWEQLELITVALVGALRRHPACADLARIAVLSCESGLYLGERTLALFADQGVGPERSAELAHFLLVSAITIASSRPGSDPDPRDSEERLRQKRLDLQALPPDRYPHVVASATFLVDCADEDAYYRRGAEFVVGGIRSQVTASRSTAG